MSYDLRIAVKVEGCGKLIDIREPELANPTYNLGKMFRACTGWDYEQGKYYNCSDVIENIDRGIRELRKRPSAYKSLEPDNGWGTLEDAVQVLESLRKCIYETAEDIPIECLLVAW